MNAYLNKVTNADSKKLTLTLEINIIDFDLSYNTKNSLDYLDNI